MLTQKKVNQLIDVQGTNCVSIYIPTYRTGNNQEDHIRFKNALSDATNQLQERGIEKKQAKEYLAKGYDLLNQDDFWLHLSDGLAVFIGKDQFEYHILPLNFNPSVRVNQHYHIRPLMPLFVGNERFFVLALSQNEVRFFEGNRYNITPVTIDDLLPTSMAEALVLEENQSTLQTHGGSSISSNVPTYHGQGAGEDEKNEDLRRYFDMVDDGLMKMLHDEKVPMVIAAVDYLVPIYRKASKYKYIIEDHISGSPDNMDPVQLHERAWEYISEIADMDKKELQEEFSGYIAGNQASTIVTDIVPASVEGKVDYLFLNKNAELWGEYNAEKHIVKIHDERQKDSQDLLEFAARKVFTQQGKVFNVDQEEFPNATAEINAIYRY